MSSIHGVFCVRMMASSRIRLRSTLMAMATCMWLLPYPKVRRRGHISLEAWERAPERPSTGDVEEPTDIAIARSSGRVYVMTQGRVMFMYDEAGNLTDRFDRIGRGAIAVDLHENVDLVEDNSSRRLTKYDSHQNPIRLGRFLAGRSLGRDISPPIRPTTYTSRTLRIAKCTSTRTSAASCRVGAPRDRTKGNS